MEDFAPYRPHPHILTGDCNLDGIHYMKTVQKTKKEQEIDFKFGIMSVRKDHMRDTLIARHTSPEAAQIPNDHKYKYKGNDISYQKEHITLLPTLYVLFYSDTLQK